MKIFKYSIIDSTQEEGKRLVKKIEKEGFENFVVLSQIQTKGRGREERGWDSKKGGLYFTYVLKKEACFNTEGLSLVVGISIREVLKEFFKIITYFKWPNDIYYKGKKLAGILLEVLREEKDFFYILIGIGINLTNEIPYELKDKAISLKETVKENFCFEKLAASISLNIDKKNERFEKHGFTYFQKCYNRAILKLKNIKLLYNEIQIEGSIKGVDRKGNLLFKTENGLLNINSARFLD